MKKLQLKKNVIARLGQTDMQQLIGGADTKPPTTITQYCATGIYYCGPTFRCDEPVEDSVHLCNTGGLQTVQVPCQY